eukprot:2430571-Pleurochrysis_carterae.AAC.1
MDARIERSVRRRTFSRQSGSSTAPTQAFSQEDSSVECMGGRCAHEARERRAHDRPGAHTRRHGGRRRAAVHPEQDRLLAAHRHPGVAPAQQQQLLLRRLGPG